jgi:hypothetical protein
MKSRYFLTAIAAIACTLSVANPQGSTLTKAQKDEVIASLSKVLVDDYVFPDVAKKMEAAFRDHQRKGDYDAITDPAAFAKTLTEHAQAISKD